MKVEDFKGKIAKLKPNAKVLIRDTGGLGGISFIVTQVMYVQCTHVFQVGFNCKPEDFIIEGYFVEKSMSGKLSFPKVEIWVDSSQIEEQPLEEQDMTVVLPYIDSMGCVKLH